MNWSYTSNGTGPFQNSVVGQLLFWFLIFPSPGAAFSVRQLARTSILLSFWDILRSLGATAGWKWTRCLVPERRNTLTSSYPAAVEWLRSTGQRAWLRETGKWLQEVDFFSGLFPTSRSRPCHIPVLILVRILGKVHLWTEHEWLTG